MHSQNRTEPFKCWTFFYNSNYACLDCLC